MVAIVKPNLGRPLAAKTIAGRVDTSNSSTTRNFIRSRYPRIATLTTQDYSAFELMAYPVLLKVIVILLSTKGSSMARKNKPGWFGIAPSTSIDGKFAFKKCRR